MTLYDFDLREDEEGEHETKIHDARLVERFDKYLTERHYGCWTVVYDWTQNNLSDSPGFGRTHIPGGPVFGG